MEISSKESMTQANLVKGKTREEQGVRLFLQAGESFSREPSEGTRAGAGDGELLILPCSTGCVRVRTKPPCCPPGWL